MDSHLTEQSTNGRSAARYTYPTGVYCPLALDRLESFQFSGYHNKRFLICQQNRLLGLRCKGTTILQNMQEKVLKICKFTMNYKQGLFFSANS